MCDNSTVVSTISNQLVHGDVIELIFLAAALYDIDINSCWLASEENWIADALSHFTLNRLANFQLDKLFTLPSCQPGNLMSH
jgi:hypothetical protein